MFSIRSVLSSMIFDSTAFPHVWFSFSPKKYNEVNLKCAYRWDPLLWSFSKVWHPLQEKIMKHSWRFCVIYIYSLEKNQTHNMIKQNLRLGITRHWHNTCTHCQRFRKDSNLQDEQSFTSCNPNFQGTTQICNIDSCIRMNVEEKFKIQIVQMSFRSELHTCEYEELKQRETIHCHDFLHEIIYCYKNIKSVHGLGGTQEKKV